MRFRRILAGTMTALVLCVSSLAAACDLSCGFALFRSDCHSPQMATGESGDSEMTMAGMTMPEMSGGRFANPQKVSSAPQAMPAHAVLVDMGACARQSCDQIQALASKTNHASAAQFKIISTIAGFSKIDSQRASFHEARDGIAPTSRLVYTPLNVSLRI